MNISSRVALPRWLTRPAGKSIPSGRGAASPHTPENAGIGAALGRDRTCPGRLWNHTGRETCRSNGNEGLVLLLATHGNNSWRGRDLAWPQNTEVRTVPDNPAHLQPGPPHTRSPPGKHSRRQAGLVTPERQAAARLYRLALRRNPSL